MFFGGTDGTAFYFSLSEILDISFLYEKSVYCISFRMYDSYKGEKLLNVSNKLGHKRGNKMEFKKTAPIVFFFFACVFFLGFFYFNSKSFIYKQEAVDISDIGLGRLKGNMHVKMDVEKCFGYYMTSKQSIGNSEKYRYYLVLHFDKSIKLYDSAFGIQVNYKDFEKWNQLVEDTKNDNEKADHIYVDGYTFGMDGEHAKIFLSALAKAGLPTSLYTGYYIVLMDVEKINFYKYACLCSAVLCTIVGAIYTNRYFNRS